MSVCNLLYFVLLKTTHFRVYHFEVNSKPWPFMFKLVPNSGNKPNISKVAVNLIWTLLFFYRYALKVDYTIITFSSVFNPQYDKLKMAATCPVIFLSHLHRWDNRLKPITNIIHWDTLNKNEPLTAGYDGEK